MIQFGLRLHDAEKLPVEQVLPLVRQKGFTCAHVALSKSFKELPCTPSALTPGYALYLRHLFEKNGIDIAVLGNYLNLAHPDADALHVVRRYTVPIIKTISVGLFLPTVPNSYVARIFLSRYWARHRKRFSVVGRRAISTVCYKGRGLMVHRRLLRRSIICRVCNSAVSPISITI